jgi:hypothetical protein
MAISFGRGYDERAAGGTSARSNGWLKYNGDTTPLWVYDVTIPMGMAGDIGQSALTRTLFPRAINQLEITLSCQTPNQKIYARTVEFIRKAQRGFSNLTELGVNGGGPQGVLKGAHSAINADGYIRNVPRRHTRFEYQPELSFTFIVATMKSPTAWADDPVQIRQLKSWQQIVEGIMAHDENAGFVDDPDRVPSEPNKPAPHRGLPPSHPTMPNGKPLPSP